MSEDAAKKMDEYLDAMAKRAADLIERESAVEEGMDHHLVLVFLAAGNVLLSGIQHPGAVMATESMLPLVCERVHAEALRRQNERDPTKN